MAHLAVLRANRQSIIHCCRQEARQKQVYNYSNLIEDCFIKVNTEANLGHMGAEGGIHWVAYKANIVFPEADTTKGLPGNKTPSTGDVVDRHTQRT